jgi:hypothetical protein
MTLVMALLACAALLFVAAIGLLLAELAVWSRSSFPLVGSGSSDACADSLLRAVLDPCEYQQLTKRGYLDVQSPSDAQRIYRIPAHDGLVRMYEGGVAVRELCVQPVEPLPGADVIAMHKLMIQGEEQLYLISARHFAATVPHERYRP